MRDAMGHYKIPFAYLLICLFGEEFTNHNVEGPVKQEKALNMSLNKSSHPTKTLWPSG